MKISAKRGRRWRLSERRRIARSRPPAHCPFVTLGTFPIGQTSSPTYSSEFLIANPRLKFPLRHSKQRTGAKSNRERTRVLRAPWRMAISCLPFSALSGFEHQAASLHNPWPPCRGRLIVTPRLEFRATRTKQTSSSTSNRYKMHFSPPLQAPPRSCASMPCCLAAAGLTRYNSGSHIEVNQP